MSDGTADWESHVGYGSAARALYFLVPTLLGAALGVGLHFLLDWMLSLPWLPFQGPLSLLDTIPDQIALPVLTGLGIVAGLIFGAFAWADELSITVDGSRLRLARGETDHVINRSAVAAVRAAPRHRRAARARSGSTAGTRRRAGRRRPGERLGDLGHQLVGLLPGQLASVVVRDQGGKQYWRAVGPDQLEA